jgi:SAM-dependent methyltransferase
MIGRRIAEIVWAASRLAIHARDPRARARYLLALEHPEGLFQPEPTTAPDRYPALFRFVREHIEDAPDRRILSFGCSTGEEVFSLRSYFPSARIKGLDIDRRNIAECEKRLLGRGGDDGLSFETRGSAAAEPASHYDAVFAMAVFRHGGLGAAPPSCESLIRFRDFETSVAELARCLKPGGLLILRHANFRFADAAASRDFRQILRAAGAGAPIYGADDRYLPNAIGDDGVFEKIAPETA